MKQDVLIVEDDAFTRQGLSTYLKTLDYVPRCAGDAQTGWERAVERSPQTAVIDIRLPLSAADATAPPTEPHGISLAKRLKQAFPTMGIILLSAHPKYEREVMQLSHHFARSVAFLHKGGNMQRLNYALQEVNAGRTVFQSEMVNYHVLETAVRAHFAAEELFWINEALNEFDQLSPREQEIASLVAASYSSDYIADRLNLARGSVDNIISRIYTKLGLADMKAETDKLRPLPLLVKTCLLHDIRRHQ